MSAAAPKHARFWLHVQDLVDAHIGPFDTPHLALAHFDMMQKRGGCAVLKQITNGEPPEGAFKLTPSLAVFPNKSKGERR